MVKESYLKSELTESQSTKGAKLFCVRLLTKMTQAAHGTGCETVNRTNEICDAVS